MSFNHPLRSQQQGPTFWCHQCRTQIQPSQNDFLCPLCGGDFIEEIETQETSTEHPSNFVPFGGVPNLAPPPHPAAQINNNPLFQGFSPAPIPFTDLLQHIEAITHQLGGNNIGPQQQQININIQQHPPIIHQIFTTGAGPGPMNFQTFMQNMLSNLGLGGPNGVVGDYAFGNLDNIITHLFETAGDRGPPPAAKEVVDTLPVETIKQQDVDNHEDCPICKEEYSLDEEVLKLECEHRFHPTCIHQWLSRRNTCPVCRFALKPEEKPANNHTNNNNNSNNNNNNGNGRNGGGGGRNPHNSADSHMQFYS